MARLDVACGHYAIKEGGWNWRVAPREVGYCLHRMVHQKYVRFLRERYGVRMEPCVLRAFMPRQVQAFAAVYNETSVSLLTKKYRKNIFAECESLAVQEWEAEGRPEE
jgi:hypothetical protein